MVDNQYRGIILMRYYGWVVSSTTKRQAFTNVVAAGIYLSGYAEKTNRETDTMLLQIKLNRCV